MIKDNIVDKDNKRIDIELLKLIKKNSNIWVLDPKNQK